jgi:hypothetical protein
VFEKAQGHRLRRIAVAAMVIRVVDDGCELLAVPRKAAALHDPSECPLDDPSTSDNDETLPP